LRRSEGRKIDGAGGFFQFFQRIPLDFSAVPPIVLTGLFFLTLSERAEP
jgi:hypothetical protein